MQSPPSNYQSQLSPPRHRGRRIAALLFVAVWLAGLGVAAAHRTTIQDWWKLRDYQAPATIVGLANADTMTDYGRKLFYINRPRLEAKSKFSSVCPNNGGEQTIVLGCYRDNQGGIFLLDVTDPRLDGVEQVTAAHEMLHAAYERLSKQDRDRIDGMLQDYYRNHLQDERVRKVVAAYKKSEPHDVVNEMHSIFGTEMTDLPPDLETYYSKYFKNRQQVAKYASAYQTEFTSRQQQIREYDQQLNELKTQVDSSEADLKSKQAAIESKQQELVALRNSNPVAYNAAVPAYNAAVDDFNAQVESVKGLISQYNQLVNRRNAVALEEGQLIKDLSTEQAPITAGN